ncbi:2-oxoglutarate and Fe(II)-dependent oxygenase superfamily protein, partial [Prunus dulcis]
LAGAASGHHRPREQWRWNRHRVPYLSRPFPAGGTAFAGRKMQKTAEMSSKLHSRRSPSSGHHFRRPRHPGPGPDRPAGETIRRSSELGPGAVACTRHPPPGHLDFRAFWFKSVGVSFGIEQNIGETLPKFR